MIHHNSREKDNDVKRHSNRISSSGRDSHVRQVVPDHNLTTVCRNGKALYPKNKQRARKTMEISIMGLCEVCRTRAGVITPDYCKLIYSGDRHERGVRVIPKGHIYLTYHGDSKYFGRILGNLTLCPGGNIKWKTF